MISSKTYKQVEEKLSELKVQLDEALETIEAIRTGKIDALIVHGEDGHQLFTLKNADQAYRVFIEKMTEGAITLNETEVILYSNSSFANMVGLPLEKVIARPFSSFVPDQFQKVFTDLIAHAWETDVKGEVFLYDSKKTLIPFQLSMTTLELDGGLAMSIILTDLRSLKASQEELRQKNEELEAANLYAFDLNVDLENKVRARTRDLMISQGNLKFLSDKIPVIVWTALPDGSIDYFNQRWFDFTGMEFEESKGAGWQQMLHPEDRERIVNVWQRAILNAGNFEIEYRWRGSDNQYRWFLGKAVPFKDEEENLIAWFGTSTDIEDQKKAIEKKDEFIGIASHELKTPLTSLTGYLQLIESYKKEELPQPVQKFVKKANEAVNKLQILVNDLLDVSKIKAGRLQFGISEMNLSELVSSCVENSRHMFPLFLFKEDIQQECMVTGNYERLEQVIMNLINNAVKYSGSSREIEIKIQKQKRSVYVSVTDFGIGLSDAEKELIFERFYRVADKNFSTSGLGMGLYISQQIVDAHHGLMGVDSRFSEGSTFYFSIPALNQSAISQDSL